MPTTATAILTSLGETFKCNLYGLIAILDLIKVVFTIWYYLQSLCSRFIESVN
jgi:hypothetical protein